jgi:hypothetical protein
VTETDDPRCLAAGAALAAGDDAAMVKHAQTCETCAFMFSLVPDLRQTLGGAGIGSAFEAILDRAIKTGELLLSRYRIERTIARGGQGIVCRASDREFGTVAIKILRCNPTSPDEPLPEGRVAIKLGGEGVCRIFNIERHGDIRMVVMELIDGECLEDALPRLSQAQRLALFRRVCEAVGRIHKDGILHLDLKPRNIVLRDDATPVVTDFGIAVPLDRDGTAKPLGHTREFAPPEQCTGDRVDRRADVHALGKVLQRLDPAPSSHIRRVIARATHPDPAQRYPDATALLRELDRPVRLRRLVLRVAAITIASLCVFGGAFVLATSKPSPSTPTPTIDPPEVVLFDFDHVHTFGQATDSYVDAAPYFRQWGITISASTGTEIVIGSSYGLYGGQALEPVSIPNVLTQRGNAGDPIFFTLTFPRHVAKISFKRPKLLALTASGITFPKWSLSALDSRGNAIRTLEEKPFGAYVDVAAKDYTLEGSCIDSVRFESDNSSRSAFRAIVIDDLVLTFARPGECDAPGATN